MKTKIVCVGDSITEGFMVETSENYPTKLQALLGDNYEVVNKGQCSTCVINLETEDGLMGFPYMRQPIYEEALLEKGDIYIVMLGTNDAQDGLDDVQDFTNPMFNMISVKEHFKPDFKKILEAIFSTGKEAGKEVKVYVCLPIPIQKCIWRKHKEEYMAVLREDLKAIVKEDERLTLIDVFDAFASLPKEEQLKLYREDMLHPNPVGYDLIAKTVYEKIVGKN